MKHKLTRNIGLKISSLAVAFIIWLVVANVDNPMDSRLYRGVKIQTANADSVTDIDKTFEFASDDTVVIKVTERVSVLDSLTTNSFTVVADMESINEMSSVPLTVICSSPFVTLDEIQVVPSSVKVKLEQKKQSDFRVDVKWTGQAAKGYEVGKAEVVQGKTVQIAGPESMIDRIGQVVASVNVNNINTDKRLNAAISVYDKNGDQITQMNRLQIKDSNGVLLTDNSVMVDITLWEVMSDIPVEVAVEGTPADGYYVTEVSTVPVTLNLVGTQEALAALNGKLIVNAPVSVEGVSESFTETLDISETLDAIEDLQLVSGNDPSITVTVQIEKTGDQTLQMPLSNLEILNRPSDMTLTFSPADELAVTVHAEDDSDRRLLLDDMKAKIDLAVCAEPGDYEIPVEIQLPNGYTLVSEVVLLVNATQQEVIEEEQAEDTEE